MGAAKKLLAKSAIFHDLHHALPGTIRKATEYGCELAIQAELDEGGPSFLRGTMLRIDLVTVDESDRESIRVELDGIRRNEHEWIYRLTWAAPPSLQIE